MNEPYDERPFGERLLEELKRLASSTARFDYATIQLIREADREAVVRFFRGKLSYATLQSIRRLDPEQAALEIHRVWLAAEHRRKML